MELSEVVVAKAHTSNGVGGVRPQTPITLHCLQNVYNIVTQCFITEEQLHLLPFSVFVCV
jgi:hypothetical protein